MNKLKKGVEMFKCEELKDRTKKYAIEIIKFSRKLPKTDESRIIGKQILRSATSVAANYRSVCRARSKAEFISKIGIVVEEIDETGFWLEIIFETDIYKSDPIERLLKEANELLAIFAASQHTAKLKP